MLYKNPAEMQDLNLSRFQIIKRIGYICGLNLLKPCGWKRFLYMHAFVVLTMTTISLYGHICFIVHNHANIDKVTESLCTCLHTFLITLKLAVLVFKQKRIRNLVQCIVDSELFINVKILDRRLKFMESLRVKVINIIEECWTRAHRQIRFYAVACVSLSSFYFFNAFFTNMYHQISGNQNHTMQFAFSTRYPGLEEGKQHLPLYPIITIVDGYACFAAGLTAIVCNGSYAYFTLHSVALFRGLKEMIVYSTSSNVPKSRKIFYLQECVDHYNRCIRFCDEINSIYSIVSLFQLLISLVVNGIIMFRAAFSLEKNAVVFINMLLYIGGSIYELFLYCFNGQYLASETDNIAETWYSCDWYGESKAFKTIVYMMMLRSSRTYYISALGFTTMSIPTFVAMAQTSGSYFMLLQNISST